MSSSSRIGCPFLRQFFHRLLFVRLFPLGLLLFRDHPILISDCIYVSVSFARSLPLFLSLYHYELVAVIDQVAWATLTNTAICRRLALFPLTLTVLGARGCFFLASVSHETCKVWWDITWPHYVHFSPFYVSKWGLDNVVFYHWPGGSPSWSL